MARATIGVTPYWKIPHYFAAQYLAGFMSSVTVFVMYYDSIKHFDGGTRISWSGAVEGGSKNATGGIFSTYPREWLSVWVPVYDQIVATAAMLIALQALTDPRTNLPDYLHPFIAGMMITGMVISFGYQCGATLNPARDLAPRLFQVIFGYGWEPFK